jgi:FkbH-like protein
MVIWDLDDTFWDGTLAEGAITPVAVNKDIVVTLAERGIISSICSKNDHAKAQAALIELDVWEYFVFPKIEFGPKGANIAAIIETAGLRPENVLFIDDNMLNLQEARHVSPGLMTALPQDCLGSLLEQPQLEGKDDRGLSRLKQYKNLEVKAVERATSSLGHEEFLRQCGISVEIDYNVESQFDRIVELANRTNQLNFTKQRLETPKAILAFRELLASYGITAGIIRVADKYGDYGITGYFVLHRKANRNDLLHFVFSCRTMNMGIEQYVYERLRAPAVTIIPPVANPISCFAAVDWITEGPAGSNGLGAASSTRKLLLLGGCELLQLASMCSSNRTEFVNTIRDGWPIRYDDPAFIAGDRAKILNNKSIEKLKYWDTTDVEAFDSNLANSEVLIVALFGMIAWNYFESDDGLIVRIAEDHLKRHLRQDGLWFVKNFRHVKLTLAKKLELITKCLDRMAKASPNQACRFVLGVSTKKMPAAARLSADGWPDCLEQGNLPSWLAVMNKMSPGERPVAVRHVFNRFLRDYCIRTSQFHFVDVESLITIDDVHDADPETGKFLPDHFSRRAYIAIAETITAGLNSNELP